MPSRPALLVQTLTWVVLCGAVGICHADESASKKSSVGDNELPAQQTFQGKVVFTHEALKRRGVKAYPEELKGQVALETKDELLPILPDWRGRAFYQDERLRNRDVELIGFRREGLPYLNVLTVYTFDAKSRRQYTDYWCDVCSIPMYEIKPCDCCQQEIRLRFGEDKGATEPTEKAGKKNVSRP
jgi:hypothetical protein